MWKIFILCAVVYGVVHFNLKEVEKIACGDIVEVKQGTVELNHGVFKTWKIID